MKFAQFLPALALTFSLYGPAYADARQDFDLANKTGYEIKEIYVSPSKSDDWQDDVLGTGTLPNGNGVHVNFHRDVHTCSWDLKVVYTEDDSSAVWQNINLCEIEKITIHYNRKSDTTSATFD